jgi:type II secretory pathway pseudopilin PulG
MNYKNFSFVRISLKINFMFLVTFYNKMRGAEMKKKGFTLIDLLIIVAIILLLAAIAAPNFLEARVRRNLARTRADFRLLATALEAYKTDHNKYPSYHYTSYEYRNDPISYAGVVNEWFIGGYVTGPGSPTYNESHPFPGPYYLTSPVAYLTTFPQDPFHKSDLITP